MFSFPSLPSVSSAKKQRLMKGALVLVGALFLLWLVVWLLPDTAPPPVSSDKAGTVATQSNARAADIPIFTPGRILVVVLLAGGIGLAVYLRSHSKASSSGPTPMQVLSRLDLNADQQLTLVRCQDDVLLLGVSPNEITLLRTYAEASFAPVPETPNSLPDSAPALNNASPSGFADVLRQYTASSRHA